MASPRSRRRFGLALAGAASLAAAACGKVVGDPILGERLGRDAGSSGGTSGASGGASGASGAGLAGGAAGSGASGGAAGGGGAGGPADAGIDAPVIEPGDPLWTVTFDGDDDDAIARDIAFDTKGHLIVSGRLSVTVDTEDTWTAKLDATGGVLWQQTVTTGKGRGRGAAVDSFDNVYVTGSIVTDRRRLFVTKYDDEGSQQWSDTYDPTDGTKADGFAVAADWNGQVVVAGLDTSPGGTNDIWLRKYDPTGAEVWTRGETSAGSMHDAGIDVALDTEGNVLVVGYVATATQGRDAWLRKYDASGAIAWTRTHDGPAAGDDQFFSVDTDLDGNVYVAGTEAGATQRGFLSRYTPNGTLEWTETFDVPGATDTTARGVAVGSDGSLVVCGIADASGSLDIWVKRFDAARSELWSFEHDEAGAADECYDVAIGAEGAVAVSGYVSRSGGDWEAWVANLAP